MFLPNGVHIYWANPSDELFDRIQGMIERREPITITSSENGVEITRTVWHPDDPLMPLPAPDEPPKRWWRKLFNRR